MPAVDWRYLRAYLLISGILLAVAGGTLLAALHWRDARQVAYDAVHAREASLQNTFNELAEARAAYDQYAAPYREFVKDGVIGKGARLEYLSALQQANTRLKLGVLTYTLQPREQLHDAGAQIGGGNIAVYATRMKVGMQALHGGDLINLVDSLGDHGFSKLMQVRYCSLKALYQGNQPDLSGRSPNLAVDCGFEWTTLEQQGDLFPAAPAGGGS